MASKAILPLQPRGGERKQKNGKVEGRNSRVLRDIGNLDINRPITRNYYKQLVGNAQAEARDKNSKKPNAKVVNGGLPAKPKAVAPKKPAVQKEESDKQKIIDVEEKFKNLCIQLAGNAKTEATDKNSKKPIAALVVNGGLQAKNEEESVKQKPISVSGKNARLGSSKKKTLSSILAARSKVYFGIFDFNPQVSCELEKNWHLKDNPMSNIDACDVNNELAVVEYVEDIYKFYKLAEEESSVHDYMGSQPDINSKMRAILIDWLIDVHWKFELMPESLYLTINVVDRYLSARTVPRKELQLIGISSMLIACKYEEYWAPKVNDLIAISGDAYGREQILLMEKAILGTLEWYLTVPTPYVFLVRYIKASLPSDQEIENMAFFLTDIGLMHYSVIVSHCPSMLAASAVYAARCTLNKSPIWTKILQHHTGYSEIQLRDCAKLLVKFHSKAEKSKLKSVYQKYLNPENGAVARFAPARSLVDASS